MKTRTYIKRREGFLVPSSYAGAAGAPASAASAEVLDSDSDPRLDLNEDVLEEFYEE